MAGLLDAFGQGFDSPQSAMIQGLAQGLMRGDFAGGLLGGSQAYGASKQNAMKMQLLQAQMAETQAQAQERQQKILMAQKAAEREATMRQGIPRLFRQPGMTGGQPQPQMEGDVPMFSRPMGAAPMQATPGGFDAIRAMQDGWKLDDIPKLAAMQELGRRKATRQMEVDDGQGGKRIALVDDFGQEVAGFAGYTAPVQVDTGKGVSFVKPMAGLNVAKVPTFGDDTARRGQDMSHSLGLANLGLARQRLATEQSAPKGQYDSARGLMIDPRTGEARPVMQNGQPIGAKEGGGNVSEGERKAATLLMRLRGSQEQLTTALKDKPDAATPGLWASGARALGAESIANTAFTSSERQRVDAAQLDILDAALTLGTGAAYTREQLEGYRKSYFPQIGDSDDNIRDKQARLSNVIKAAEVAAGRAGGQVPTKAKPVAAEPDWIFKDGKLVKAR